MSGASQRKRKRLAAMTRLPWIQREQRIRVVCGYLADARPVFALARSSRGRDWTEVLTPFKHAANSFASGALTDPAWVYRPQCVIYLHGDTVIDNGLVPEMTSAQLAERHLQPQVIGQPIVLLLREWWFDHHERMVRIENLGLRAKIQCTCHCGLRLSIRMELATTVLDALAERGQDTANCVLLDSLDKRAGRQRP